MHVSCGAASARVRVRLRALSMPSPRGARAQAAWPPLRAPLAPCAFAPPVSAVAIAASVVSAAGTGNVTLVPVTLSLSAWPVLAGGDSYAIVVSCAGSDFGAAGSAGPSDNACSSVGLRLARAAPAPQQPAGPVELLPAWTGSPVAPVLSPDA